jgi:MFS family permease
MRLKFFYGYVIVASVFVIMAMIWGTNTAYGVFLDPILREYGWTRAISAGAASLNNILFGLVCMVSARVSDKFGPRLVISICGVIMAVGYFLMRYTDSPWHLYLFFGLIVPVGMSPYISTLSLVARWFEKKRATMTAIAFSGMAIGTMVIPFMAGQLISVYQWRMALVIVSAISLVLFVAAAQFLRPALVQTSPLVQEQAGMYPKGPELTLNEALSTRQFWILGMLYFVFLYSLLTTVVHIVVHATGLGVSLTSAATSMTIVGGLCLAGMNIMGPIADKLGNRPALAISFGVMAVSMYWLMAAQDLWGIYLFAGIFGFAYGGMQTLFSPSVAELFGLRSHGTILGAAAFVGSVGAALGPFISGYIFDTSQSYKFAFLICALLANIAVVLAVLLKPLSTVRAKQGAVTAPDEA